MKICKRRNKVQTWCKEYLSDCEEVVLQWKKCTCEQCFLSAIHGRRPDNGHINSEIIRDTAGRWLELKRIKGELE